MSIEILTIIPTSGELPEHHFGAHFNSRLWIKFIDNQYEEWIGCFSMSYDHGLCQTLSSADNSTAFIVAGGQGYLIDITKRSLTLELENYPLIESAISTNKPDYFLIGTFYSIYILNTTGLVKIVQPEMIVDGIYFKGQVAHKAVGELATAVNQYSKNIDFELDLETFQLTLNYSEVLNNVGLLERIWKRLKK